MVSVGRWVIWRTLNGFTHMPGALVGMAGRHRLECPWEHRHLHLIVSGLLPGGSFPSEHFKRKEVEAIGVLSLGATSATCEW